MSAVEALQEDIEKARESNAAAAMSLDDAKVLHTEMMNEYVKTGYESVAENCQTVKTPFSTGNIFFGRKNTKVPRDDIFETAAGKKLKRKPLANEIQETVINASGEQNDDWKASSKTQGVVIQYSPSRSTDEATFYRAKAELKVSPRELLITQIRSSVVGAADDSLIYMREHYSFVDGKSFLFHQVRKALPKILGLDLFQLRDFFDFVSWEEHDDGTIIYASQSVNLPANIKGCTRGDNLIFGIIMKPVTQDDGETVYSDVTLVTQFRPNGFAPGKLVDAFAPRGIGAYLKSAEKSAIELRENGETEALVKKYIEMDLE